MYIDTLNGKGQIAQVAASQDRMYLYKSGDARIFVEGVSYETRKRIKSKKA